MKKKQMVAVVYEIIGYLTTRDERLTLSAKDNAAPAVEAVSEFLNTKGLAEVDADFDFEWDDLFADESPEIDKLANYIMSEVDGEPSKSEGAGECAIRLLTVATEENARYKKALGDIGHGADEGGWDLKMIRDYVAKIIRELAALSNGG